ncbi:GroES family chaperonin [Glycomyces xiaoerkulensis]|uniref:GroES family chaperonin n=1 Tax=Glycomyces xiaoerkulensis TaxID=2038139 RepID=UPI0012FFF0BD|nr:co-chaperone GroES [Glycomyces xiaoerkulensis]
MTDTPFDSETGLPIRLLHDRLLVREDVDAERHSAGGIVIPATATMGKRLHWAEAVAVGPLVRSVEAEDRVLFDREDKAEVELQGRTFILLRERDIHAVAAKRVDDDATGLYL